MRINKIIWLDEIIDKLETKHNIRQEEVIELIHNEPHFRFVEKGHRPSENVYAAMGQTDAGRYLIVFFIHKADGSALILSGRTMTPSERKRHEKK
jgi:uncharacterized DUF497 family protein